MSPPRLDYVSMLLYFAADPNPRHGFIRALSVVLGQFVGRPPSSLLVKVRRKVNETQFNCISLFDFCYQMQHGFLTIKRVKLRSYLCNFQSDFLTDYLCHVVIVCCSLWRV